MYNTSASSTTASHPIATILSIAIDANYTGNNNKQM